MGECDDSWLNDISGRIIIEEVAYTIGVFVMSNFGKMENLKIDGIPVGRIAPQFEKINKREFSYGSIIAVLATNAPLLPLQIQRLCKRAALGIGRAGSYAASESGEIIIGFSTANTVPRQTKKMTYQMKLLLDQALNPIYEAVVEATEEAILNALSTAETMIGHSGNTAHALPLAQVKEIYQRFSDKFWK